MNTRSEAAANAQQRITVDEILATGKYTDRRGREWRHIHRDGRWFHEPDGLWFKDGKKVIKMMRTEQMRLLIERDLHRNECGELPWCDKHPVPSVIVCHEPGEGWGKFKVIAHGKAEVFRTFPEAMDAARALAVGE